MDRDQALTDLARALRRPAGEVRSDLAAVADLAGLEWDQVLAALAAYPGPDLAAALGRLQAGPGRPAAGRQAEPERPG